MATEFCQRCKQSHPGRVCDYDDKGECAQRIEPEDRENEKNQSSVDKWNKRVSQEDDRQRSEQSRRG
jgi:hypothetical protein